MVKVGGMSTYPGFVPNPRRMCIYKFIELKPHLESALTQKTGGEWHSEIRNSTAGFRRGL